MAGLGVVFGVSGWRAAGWPWSLGVKGVVLVGVSGLGLRGGRLGESSSPGLGPGLAGGGAAANNKQQGGSHKVFCIQRTT